MTDEDKTKQEQELERNDAKADLEPDVEGHQLGRADAGRHDAGRHDAGRHDAGRNDA